MNGVPDRVLFVAARDAAPTPEDGTVVVVADTTWTPSPNERPDVIPLRPVVARIVETIDLFDEALERLDAWAAAGEVATRSMSDGIATWHQIREAAWSWLHERLLWAYTLSEVAGSGSVLEIATGIDEPALVDVVQAREARSSPASRPGSSAHALPGVDFALPVPERGPGDRRTQGLRGILRSARDRALGPSISASSSSRTPDLLDDRVARLAAHGGLGVLVVSYGRVSQVIGQGGAARIVDPNIATVIDRLEAVGLEPIVLAFGGGPRPDAPGETTAEGDRLGLPAGLLATRWADPSDPDQGRDATSAAADALDAAMVTSLSTPLVVAAVDLGPALGAEVRLMARDAVQANERVGARVGRMLDELRPAAVVLTHEGLRTAWLVAAKARGIPTFAIQHGVIYPTHPGYRHVREPGLVLPTRTFVYGDYERRTLLAHGGYLADEVMVSGAPRLDLDATSAGAEGPAERDAVRRELGVADRHRLLVVSTVNVPFLQKSHYLHMIGRILGAPLPDVHVVFKQHPGEADEGPYRDLLLGIARAGGFEPPPISVVKDIDLYRLLRAADAHLGLFSTVLTDAVIAGTPNLLADVNAHGDLLGYVAAGVATPVRTPADLLRALADPRPVDPDARKAFVDDHFRPGDASARIAAEVARAVHGSVGPT